MFRPRPNFVKRDLYFTPCLLPYFLVCIAALASGATVAQPAARATHQRAPFWLNTAPGVKYVGSRVCAVCHSKIYQSYKKTWMGLSMTFPSNPPLPILPSHPVVVHFKNNSKQVSIYTEGKNLFQREYQLDANGKIVFSDTHKIAYIIGAGEGGFGFIVRRGNFLFEAPASYYMKSHSFDLSPGYAQSDHGFSRPVAARCITCHSGRPNPVPDRPGFYKNPPFHELAIGCEDCHGPGELHVAARMKGEPVKGHIDRTIVDPSFLPAWLANNICMRCHQTGDARVVEPGKTILAFRPGTPLDKTIAIFAVPFTRASPPQDPLLQQYMQMILSRCYLKSGGKLKCITCHDPHVMPTQAEAPAFYRRMCLQCHTEKSCTLPLSVRMSQSPPNDCIRCHMPQRKLEKIPHAWLTYHRIIAYAGEPYPRITYHMTTPELPNLVHLDAIPGSTAPPSPSVLLSAYVGLSSTHPQYKEACKGLIQPVIDAKLKDSATLANIVHCIMITKGATGKASALNYMARAIEAGAATDVEYDIYAQLLVSARQAPKAVAVLNRGIAEYPYSALLLNEQAEVYFRLKRYNAGLETLERELTIFPENNALRNFLTKVNQQARRPSP